MLMSRIGAVSALSTTTLDARAEISQRCGGMRADSYPITFNGAQPDIPAARSVFFFLLRGGECEFCENSSTVRFFVHPWFLVLMNRYFFFIENFPKLTLLLVKWVTLANAACDRFYVPVETR